MIINLKIYVFSFFFIPVTNIRISHIKYYDPLAMETILRISKYEKKNYRKEKRERERKKRTQHGSEQCLKSGQN